MADTPRRRNKLRAWSVRRDGVAHLRLELEEHATQREVDPLELAEAIADEEDARGEFFAHYNPAPLEVRLADELALMNGAELGDDGTRYNGGINNDKDKKWNYRPFNGRGLRTDYGVFHQALLDELQIMRPWSDIHNALRSGDWWVEPPDEERQERADDLQRALFDIHGGWDKFLIEAAYAFITGFVLFEEVFSLEDLTIDKLAFRQPKQVLEWILDEHNRDLVAIRLTRGDTSGGDYYLPASAVLLINVNAVGNDFEGISPLRPVIKYVLAKEMFDRLEARAGEKWGMPVFVLSQADNEKAADEDETALFTNILDALAAEDAAVIELPDGKTFELISPQGVMPSFTELKRYCDEQIAMSLQGEGTLLGMQGNGSRALAEVADNRVLRSTPAYAKVICAAINGARGTTYKGTLRKLERLRFGEPEDGKWCELRFSLDRNGRDSEWFAQLTQAKSANLLTWEAEDEEQLREEMNLRKRAAPAAQPAPAALAPTSSGGET